MGYIALCAFTFCVHVATVGRDLSDLKVQLDNLRHQSRLRAHYFANLSDLLEQNIKTRIEETMYDTVANYTGYTLQRYQFLTERAKEAPNDPDSCYDSFQEQIISDANKTIAKMKPCVEMIEFRYRQYSNSFNSNKRRCEELELSIKDVENYCGNLEPKEEYDCVKQKLHKYTQEHDSLTNEYQVSSELYSYILDMVNEAVHCVAQYKKEYMGRTFSTLAQAAKCVQT